MCGRRERRSTNGRGELGNRRRGRMIVGPPSGLPSSPPGGVVGDLTASAQRLGLDVGNEVGAIGLVGSAAFAGRFRSEVRGRCGRRHPGPARHPSGVRRGVAVQSPRDKKDSTAPVCRLGGGRRVPPDHPGGHAPGRQGRAAKSRPSHSPVPFSITIRYYHHLNPFPNHPDPT